MFVVAVGILVLAASQMVIAPVSAWASISHDYIGSLITSEYPELRDTTILNGDVFRSGAVFGDILWLMGYAAEYLGGCDGCSGFGLHNHGDYLGRTMYQMATTRDEKIWAAGFMTHFESDWYWHKYLQYTGVSPGWGWENYFKLVQDAIAVDKEGDLLPGVPIVYPQLLDKAIAADYPSTYGAALGCSDSSNAGQLACIEAIGESTGLLWQLTAIDEVVVIAMYPLVQVLTSKVFCPSGDDYTNWNLFSLWCVAYVEPHEAKSKGSQSTTGLFFYYTENSALDSVILIKFPGTTVAYRGGPIIHPWKGHAWNGKYTEMRGGPCDLGFVRVPDGFVGIASHESGRGGISSWNWASDDPHDCRVVIHTYAKHSSPKSWGKMSFTYAILEKSEKTAPAKYSLPIENMDNATVAEIQREANATLTTLPGLGDPVAMKEIGIELAVPAGMTKDYVISSIGTTFNHFQRDLNQTAESLANCSDTDQSKYALQCSIQQQSNGMLRFHLALPPSSNEPSSAPHPNNTFLHKMADITAEGMRALENITIMEGWLSHLGGRPVASEYNDTNYSEPVDPISYVCTNSTSPNSATANTCDQPIVMPNATDYEPIVGGLEFMPPTAWNNTSGFGTSSDNVATLTATLTPSYEGVPVSLYYGTAASNILPSTESWTPLASGRTNSMGSFATTFVPLQEWTPPPQGEPWPAENSTECLRADFGTPTFPIPGYQPFNVTTDTCNPQTPASITLTMGQSLVNIGTTPAANETLVATINPPAPNITVSIYYSNSTNGNWTLISTGNTGTNGNYTITWTPTSTGSYYFRADSAGNDTLAPATTITATSITAVPEFMPLTSGLMITLALMLCATLVRRTRRRNEAIDPL